MSDIVALAIVLGLAVVPYAAAVCCVLDEFQADMDRWREDIRRRRAK